MQFGDNITSLSGVRLFPGMPAGYNGSDFDLLRSTPDNVDGIAVVSGGQSGGAGRVFAELAGFNGTTWDRIRSAPDNADGLVVTTLGALRLISEQFVFNGTNFDRIRGNLDNITLNTLTAASTNGQSTDQTNFNGRGVKIFTNLTAVTGTSPSLTISVQGKDPVSAQYFTLLTGTALITTGTQMLTVYPGVAVTANVSASDILPRTWRVLFVITGTTPAFTGTIAASVIG